MCITAFTKNGEPIPMPPNPCGWIIRSASTSSNRNGSARNIPAMPAASSRNGGYARGKFEKWWHERAALGCPMPRSAREAVSLANEGLLAAPESITVKTIAGERFERITGWRLKKRPVMREPGEDLEVGETWVSTTSPDDPEEEIPF